MYNEENVKDHSNFIANTFHVLLWQLTPKIVSFLLG